VHQAATQRQIKHSNKAIFGARGIAEPLHSGVAAGRVTTKMLQGSGN